MAAFANENRQISMLFVTDANSSAAYAQHRNGAELGIAEANIQGRFLGIDYQLLDRNPQQASQIDIDNLPAAVVVAGEDDLLKQMQKLYSEHQVPVFNAALADDGLRKSCFKNVFHTPPSNKMLADAVAQWQQTHQGAQVMAAAWHPDFVKFAGRDLNKRYTEQYQIPMNDDAWAGWAATRMVAEAVVRTSSNDPAEISRYLREDLEFDAQKGVPQSFRVTGQLRQPLLIVSLQGELLGEAPVRGVADYEDLDTLGILSCDKQ